MPKVLMVCPNEVKKSFVKLLKKCGIFQKDDEIQVVNPHVPVEKISLKRQTFGATRVIYVGIEACKLGDYQAQVSSRTRPGEKIIQCAVDCKEPGRKPAEANQVHLFSSPDKMTTYLRGVI